MINDFIVPIFLQNLFENNFHGFIQEKKGDFGDLTYFKTSDNDFFLTNTENYFIVTS